jgi:uncharacterized glyoxalase superfamily protein PhnB
MVPQDKRLEARLGLITAISVTQSYTAISLHSAWLGGMALGVPAGGSTAQMLTFRGIYLFVEELADAIAFYRLLGFEIERVSSVFARATTNGFVIELGTAELTRSYDPNWALPGTPTKNTINLELSSQSAVDETYARMVQAGYRGHLAPCDPPWEARFAIVEDPDGNFIGLHSPRDLLADRRRERAA